MKGPTDIHKVYGQIWNLKSDQLTLNLKKQAPIEEGKLFKKWIEELSQLENFTITRSFLPVTFQEVSVAAFREVNAGRENMLHSFRDASNVGLGINCYVVIEGHNGTRYSELAFCKAKVLPQSQNFRKIWQPQY